MFCLCSTEALRRAAAQGFGSIGAQDKFIYGQRRCAALPVWKKEGWREDAPRTGLRRIAA